VAKWLAERVQEEGLRMLLVVNPTADLDGAEEEGRRLRGLQREMPAVRLEQLWREEATRPALLAALSSGEYDVVHYAGHAFFDEDNPERSGIVCHNGAVLSGADLAALAELPLLAFFNACESGRLRKVDGRVVPVGPQNVTRPLEQLRDTIGMAEAFLRGGIANFIGTYWPVGDRPAATFASLFYREILRGEPINRALQAGRRAVLEIPSRDWADYVFYGNPDFVLKAGLGNRARP
jgi:CHAT domain-containing protein